MALWARGAGAERPIALNADVEAGISISITVASVFTPRVGVDGRVIHSHTIQESGKMKRLILPVLAMALLALPSLAEAQGQGRGGGMMGILNQQNPIDLILTRADSLQLGLTAAEVTQLTTIRDELTAQNAPHQTALQGLLQGLASGGTPDPSIIGQIQQHTQPMQAANQAALTRVRGMLTAEQVTKIDAMLAAMQPARGGRLGGGGGPG